MLCLGIAQTIHPLEQFTDKIIRALKWSCEEYCFIIGVKLVLIEGEGKWNVL